MICLVVNVVVPVIKTCLCVYWVLSIVVSHLQYIYIYIYIIKKKLFNCVLPKNINCGEVDDTLLNCVYDSIYDL